MALWAGRRSTGLTLRELGDAAGGMDYAAVSAAVRLIERRDTANPVLRTAMKMLAEYLNFET